MPVRERASAWDSIAIAICALWIFILLSSGLIEREVLVLHVLQSAIYAAALALIARKSKWGLGIAASIAFIWDYGNLHTGFIFDLGFRVWRGFLHTGHIERFVPWEATIGWFAHLLLIAACIAAWGQHADRRPRDIAGFVVAFAATYVYFGVILYFFGRFFFARYLRLFLP
ncbi:MAG TPA: hypothetical protein VFL36_17385 [Myxococcales bacterium]|nr:hypothetical protein [Myxococcales bacterium]